MAVTTIAATAAATAPIVSPVSMLPRTALAASEDGCGYASKTEVLEYFTDLGLAAFAARRFIVRMVVILTPMTTAI